MDFKLNSGLSLYVVGSAIQKSIRRSNCKQALYFSRELYHEGHDNYVWKRLVISCLEDVGLANIDLLGEIYALHQSYLQIKVVRKTGKSLGWFVISKAVHLLCNATKNHAGYNAAIWLEHNNTALDVKGKANILDLYAQNCLNKSEHQALNTMFAYLQKHRIQGLFEKMLEFALVNCSIRVSNFVQWSHLLFRELLNKKKYQMPFVVSITLVLSRASRCDKTVSTLARESIKGLHSFDIPKYAHDQTTGQQLNRQSDKLDKEVIYALDSFYRDFVNSLYQ